MNPFKNTNPAIRDITDIAASKNVVAIETPWKGCWRVTVNKKPASDWSDEASAISHAKRLGWRGNGKPQGQPATLANERTAGAAAFVNTREDGVVMLSIGPVLKFAA